jgi:hypothetical protein
MASGDDIEAGRVTGAESRTILVGQKPSDLGNDFNGDFVFQASPYAVGGDEPISPDKDVDGVRGLGNRGGTGVVGLGAMNDRSGSTISGTGVFGQGGNADTGRFGGTGVVGQAGRSNGQMGGTGVVGLGGKGDSPHNGGPGVVGRGGDDKGAGVVGVAAGHDLPDEVHLGDRGVVGKGFVGVVGYGDPGAGVRGESINNEGIFGHSEVSLGGNFRSNKGEGVSGYSAESRGGIFESSRVAQLRLVPQEQATLSPSLPKRGKVGDLFLVRNTAKNQDGVLIDGCSLWLCVPKTPNKEDSDQWQPVVLGPAVTGTS